METISIYTDGSCSVKTREGGWAFIYTFGGLFKESYGHSSDTTVNRMELTAILKAVQSIPPHNTPVRIFSDSEYSVNCINTWCARWELKGWEAYDGAQVLNADILKSLHKLFKKEQQRRAITISWVKGHNKNHYNERADYLCGEARVNKANYTGGLQSRKPFKIALVKKLGTTLAETAFIVINRDTKVILSASTALDKIIGKQLFNVEAYIRKKGFVRSQRFKLPKKINETSYPRHQKTE